MGTIARLGLGGGKVPLWVKLLYTAFVAVLVPRYWLQYGPVNFLWFCDVALLVTLAALWLESPLLAGTQAVGIVLPQLIWVVDFLVRLVSGDHIPGRLSEYMFRPDIPVFTRGLSLFHGWLPLLLLWLVWRLGYDRRAVWVQMLLAWGALLLCFVLVEGPGSPGEAVNNVNKILGPDDTRPQTWVPPALWLAALMVAYPVCIYLPTHLLFCWLMPRPEDRRQPA